MGMLVTVKLQLCSLCCTCKLANCSRQPYPNAWTCMLQHEASICCRQLSARAGDVHRARAATDAYRIELLQAKLGDRELDVQGLQESLASLEEENTGVMMTSWHQHT